MSELEFLHALHVDTLRHDGMNVGRGPHELFQTSTIQALLGGAFDGDVTLEELLAHGNLGLGTLNGLDGELIVIDGQVFKSDLDCRLSRPPGDALTPYAVVVQFDSAHPSRVQAITGPLRAAEVERRLWPERDLPDGPEAIRIDGHFDSIRLRSVPRQTPPYPLLAQAISHQHIHELRGVSGTMVGFCFPDGLAGIEIVGSHLHFAGDDRARGGHVLDYTVREATVLFDDATQLHVELPGAVAAPDRGGGVDQRALRRLEH
jgi:acetolactate decarboxylase